ncbi:ATP-dependent Clp protease proteolytic subunit [Methylotenera sp.]|uniref:ATP-dependent Clp protease proteolytic subunit n=1 Tax=Methylotenera sp. TaxID=2051956 RepID=UPI00273190D5|nr:ATP-dependent Clp protease proteolytic subunit [Methylotenera sp.]MDP2231188.1 ATP-dependent Clp protease proteolytic subunit [Methylotenera sp.]
MPNFIYTTFKKTTKIHNQLLAIVLISIASITQIHASECQVSANITHLSRIILEVYLEDGCRQVYLSSPGGDVSEALEMGRSMRKYQASAIISGGKWCSSACVLLYAAGVTRTPYGELHIHRPYHEMSSSSFTSEQSRYDKLSIKVRTYLKEMNVNEALYEEMMKVPPESSKPLTLDEMQSFGLTYVDPVYAEFRSSQIAERAGLSKETFLRKKRLATEKCGHDGFDAPIQSSEENESKSCWKKEFPEYPWGGADARKNSI